MVQDTEEAAASLGGEHLTRIALQAARVLWIVMAALSVVMNILGVPIAFRGVQRICSHLDPTDCGPNQLRPETALRLHELGISTSVYASYFVTLSLLFTATYLAVGILLFVRRSNDSIALLVAFLLVTFGGSYVTGLSPALAGTYEEWLLPIRILRIGALATIGLTFFLFPSGRFVPRWSRWIAIPYVVLCALFTLFPSAQFIGTELDWIAVMYGLLVLAAIPFFVIVQIHRYRRVSSPVEREKTRWVVFGISAAILNFITLVLVYLIWNEVSTADPLAVIAGITAVYLGFLLIPVTIALAVMRHRLFDIDVIINRTLVYGTLTAILATVYLVVVVGGQRLMNLLTGESGQQTFIIVVTTLLVAALFQPLRRRVQVAIDRRFYRAKYDAAKTITAFGAALRHEVELAALSQRLAGTVEETMHPAKVSLWLRTPHQRER